MIVIGHCEACGIEHCTHCAEIHRPGELSRVCDNCSFEMFGELMTVDELRGLVLNADNARALDNMLFGRPSQSVHIHLGSNSDAPFIQWLRSNGFEVES